MLEFSHFYVDSEDDIQKLTMKQCFSEKKYQVLHWRSQQRKTPSGSVKWDEVCTFHRPFGLKLQIYQQTSVLQSVFY